MAVKDKVKKNKVSLQCNPVKPDRVYRIGRCDLMNNGDSSIPCGAMSNYCASCALGDVSSSSWKSIKYGINDDWCTSTCNAKQILIALHTMISVLKTKRKTQRNYVITR